MNATAVALPVFTHETLKNGEAIERWWRRATGLTRHQSPCPPGCQRRKAGGPFLLAGTQDGRPAGLRVHPRAAEHAVEPQRDGFGRTGGGRRRRPMVTSLEQPFPRRSWRRESMTSQPEALRAGYRKYVEDRHRERLVLPKCANVRWTRSGVAGGSENASAEDGRCKTRPSASGTPTGARAVERIPSGTASVLMWCPEGYVIGPRRRRAEAQALASASCAEELAASRGELVREVHAIGLERLEACVETATVARTASRMSWPLGSTASEVGRTA